MGLAIQVVYALWMQSAWGIFGLIFVRITLKKIKLKNLFKKKIICVWFEYIKNKFKIMIFI